MPTSAGRYDDDDLDWHDDVYSGPDHHDDLFAAYIIDYDDLSRLHAGDTDRADHHDHGGADINDKHDRRRPHELFLVDPDDIKHLDVLDTAGTHYVLVRRADYDNLVAAVEHHIYDGVDYPVNDAARKLIDHVDTA